MNNEFDAQLQAIDQTTLTPVVRRALGSETVEVIHWDYQQIHGGAGGGVGGTAIYRFAGQGRDQGKMVPWSVILKVLWAQADSDESDCYYWRREAVAYQSGWLEDLPGGLAAPQCFGIVEHPGEACWLWLEEVVDEIGQWPLEHYGLVAYHLGQFNGAYLTGELPSWSWLSSGWLRASVVQIVPAITQLRDLLEHPLVRRWLPGDTSDGVFRQWARRETFLDALDRLPHTLCHLDAFRRNLFGRRSADGRDQTVAIDWAFAGTGAVGEEIEPLVNRSLGFLEVDPTRAQELDDIVFGGYLEGLRDAGWRGDPGQVRLGYTAATTLRALVSYGQIVLALIDESKHSLIEQLWGYSVEEIMDRVAEVVCFQLGLSDEAWELLGSLG
ncbi:MAG: hypothetical protein ACP5J4_19710 [Anaerolineae bacterium]